MIEQILSPELIHAMGWTLVHSLWQGALFAVALGLLLVLLRKFSARARYNVAIGMFCAFLLTAGLSFVQMYTTASPAENAVMSTSRLEQVQVEGADGILLNTPDRKPNITSVAQAPLVSPSFRERFVNYYNEHLPLIVTLWLMGVLVLQLRFLGQLAYVQRLKNYGTERFPAKWAVQIQELETRLDISRPVRYLTSFRVNSPLTLGWMNPVVLFPPALLAELKESQVVTILAHELAHVKRNDFAVNLVQTLLCTLFFFHPATWWMSARINEEREHCCDDLAIEVTGEAVGYAKTLLRMKEKELKTEGALAMAFRGKEASGFNFRIRRLVSGYLNGATYGEGLITALILVAALGTAVAASDGDQTQLVEGETPQLENTIATEDIVEDAAIAFETLDLSTEVGDALSDIGPMKDKRHSSGVEEAFDDWAATEGENVLRDRASSLPDSLEFPFLMEAVNDGNYDLVKYFLSKKVNVNQVDAVGWTPLMVAVSEDHVRIVRLLINAGADVNMVNHRGWTALIEAADEGATASVQVLLEAGAKTDLPGTSSSAVDLAASEGHPDILRLLVEKGADISGLARRSTPLHRAAEEGKLDIVKSLIEAGAGAGAGDENGRTPLHFAAAEGKTEVVEYLLEKGVDPNKGDNDGRSALTYAAEEGKLKVIRILRANGAAIDAADNGGRSPIHYAVSEGKLKMVELFLENGGTAHVGDRRGRTPLHYAAAEVDDDMIKLLLANGAVANAKDNEGLTALDYAINQIIDETENELRHANIRSQGTAIISTTTNGPEGEVIKLLIQAGATSSRIDEYGNVRMTVDEDHGFHYDSFDHDYDYDNDVNEVNEANVPNEANAPNRNNSRVNRSVNRSVSRGDDDTSGELLVDAVRKGRNRTIDQLIASGKDVDGLGRNGRTPLTEASFLNYNIHTHQLVKGGADINKRDADGYTPLTMAVTHNNYSTVETLLELGASPDLKDGNGVTAKQIVLRDNYPEILRLLNESGASITAVDRNGNSPLSIPAREGNLESLRYLLEQGVDPDGGNGCHPLFQSAREGHAEAIALLAKHNANLEMGCDYRDTDFFRREIPGGGGSLAIYDMGTPLMVALTQTDVNAVSVLLASGANVNATCRKARFTSEREITWRESENLTKAELTGRFETIYNVSHWTPLMEAVESGKVELVQLLLRAGADKAKVAGPGMTAMSVAEKLGDNEIIALLR